MKKIILLVASVLSAIQLFSNRNVEGTNTNSLILSPSDGIYSHGSHVSHASHYSHNSMMFAVKTDSVNSLTASNADFIKSSLAQAYNCDFDSIEFRHLFVSTNSYIYKSHNGSIKNPYLKVFATKKKEKCLYISFKIMSKEENGFIYMVEGGEYLIPISNPDNSVYYYIKDQFPPNKCEIGDLTNWMKTLIGSLI